MFDGTADRVVRAAVIGASGGIGAALVAALAGQSATVYALSRHVAVTRDARILTAPIDIADEGSIAAAAATVEGPLDLIVVATGLLHCEGVAPEKSWRDLSAETLAAYFQVNTIGPALVAKHFLPLLQRHQRGVFAALSARVGSIGDNRLGGWHGYRASKTALNMLIRTLSIELARTRPQAVCVGLHPGTVATPLSAPFQRGLQPDQLQQPAVAAARLLDVLAGLQPDQSGRCFDWRGDEIPA